MINTQRRNEIIRLKNEGKSLNNIGKIFNISGERVRTIILIKKFRSGRDIVRDKVRKRDNNICQKCGKKWIEGQRKFDVHHLNKLCGERSRKYDKVADIPNLITYCHKCHLNLKEVRDKMSKPR